MRLREYEVGKTVKICNGQDFAMSHKTIIGKVGTIVRRTRKGDVLVQLDTGEVAVPMYALTVLEVDDV